MTRKQRQVPMLLVVLTVASAVAFGVLRLLG